MGLFQIFNENINSKNSTRLRWDSRQCSELKRLHLMTHAEIQNFIESEDKYSIYYKCFISNEYLIHIHQYSSHNKTYNKCEFEIDTNTEIGYFLSNNTFNNCVFYFNNSNSLVNILELFHKDVLSKISDNNIIIKNSYIEHLAQQYNYNLDKVSNKLLCGISINNIDLSKYTLPSNPLFFQHIATKDMFNVTFGEVDFRKYDMSNLVFNNITFSSNTFLSEEMLCNTFNNCILPSIDFTLYNESLYKRFRFFKCTFTDNTIFPNNEDFFINCTITECVLPTCNYSKYLINHNTFKNCYFTNDSTLPDAIFTSKYIYKINYIQHIPQKHLANCVKFAYIYNPILFLEQYIDLLNLPTYALLCKKYNIIQSI